MAGTLERNTARTSVSGQKWHAAAARTMSDRKFAWLLVTPIVLVMAVLAIGPLVYAVVVSVVKLDLTRGGMAGFVGLDNYRYVLFQPAFWNAIGTTLELTVKAVGLQMGLGILIAWLLTRTSHYRSIFTALLILPLATAPAVTGLFWRYLYDTEFGVINALCSFFGFPDLNWLGSVDLALWAVVIFDVWQWTPFVALIIFAGLQSLPVAPYEAAALDGASRWTVFRTLTFPLMKPILFLVVILRTIDSLRLYDAVAVLTRGGPGDTTETLTYFMRKTALILWRMDYASAMSLIYLYALLVLSVFALQPLLKVFIDRSKE